MDVGGSVVHVFWVKLSPGQGARSSPVVMTGAGVKSSLVVSSRARVGSSGIWDWGTLPK